MNKVKSILSRFWNGHKKAIIIMIVGFVVLQISIIAMRSLDPVMPGWMSMLRYLSYFAILLGLLMITGKKKWFITSNIVIVVMLLWLVEVVCFALLGFPDTQIKTFTPQTFEKGNRLSYLGFGSIPDTTYTEHTLNSTGDTLYSATYTIDKNGYRVTPDIDTNSGEYNLFFGCSIGLGYGLNDDQTLAYHYQTQNKDKSYNFSWNGYGTSHMLSILQNENLNQIVEEGNGTAYYVFFWDHIYRSLGAMKHYNGWMHTSPYYYLDDGKLVQDRTFVDGRYWLSKFYEEFNKSAIKNYFEIELPFKTKEAHYDLVSEIILESKKEYEKQFGNDNFVLVIYPSYVTYTPEEMKSFLGYLKKKKIRYIDLSKTIKYGGPHTLKGDSHPNSTTNKRVANELYKRNK